MKLFLRILLVNTLVLLGFNLKSQNVGINGTGAAPDGGAMLDVSATNKGVLIPRVNIANLATIAPIVGSTTTSMLVYNTNGTTGQGYYYWDGTRWVKFTTGGDDWKIIGNANTTQGTNFLGTTNGTGLDFRTNNTIRFRIINGYQLQAFNNGTAAAPIYSRSTDPNTGMYFSGADQLSFSEGGTEALRITNNDRIRALNGSAALPTWSFINDSNIGMYRVGTDNLGFSTVGIERFRMTSTTAVFNELSNDYDFRVESNNQANQFFVNAGNDRIGIRTGAPTNMLHMTNGGVNVGATAMANFANLGASGVALGARNTSATSGYNASEFITDYAGTAFLTAGIMGLAIYQGAVNCNSIGVRAATNEWQGTGIYASRFNSGGANTGWGGQVYNDLGYTGFFGAISDERTKKDVNKIEGAMTIINQLNPVTYYFDLEKYPTMGLNEEMEYGFIAQEVRQILPEVTRIKGFDPNSCVEMKENQQIENKREMFVVMDYTRIIPILTKGIQEQQAEIEKQNAKIEALEKIVLELQQKVNQ